MTPGPPFATLLILALASGGNSDIDACAKESAHYQAIVGALTEALRAYEKCMRASRGRDPCTAEYEDLDVAQDKFETAVEDHARPCSVPKPGGER